MKKLSKTEFLTLWEHDRREQFRKKMHDRYSTINANRFDDREHLAYVSDKAERARTEGYESDDHRLRSKYI